MCQKKMKRAAFLVVLLLASLSAARAPLEVTVDLQKTVKSHLNQGMASANLCWLLDSDEKHPRSVSMEMALRELGVGSLRFPYGHLADNYLWHTPPFNQTERGLRPKVASPGQAPGTWAWAVDGQGGFKSAMDFDEYMQLCRSLSVEPLVVVNLLSFKYKGGPSYERLKETAVEWVRYAKKKGYKVAYWQIGNEVDHHRDLINRAEYVKCYIDFVAAMKSVDSSIKCGPGILSSVRIFKQIIEKQPKLIDFVSCHQYMYRFQEPCKNYKRWKESDETTGYIPNIMAMKNAVRASAKPDLPILVTETGITPANERVGKINNTYKALWWFEVLMNEISTKNVAYIYNWGTHSPWAGNADREDYDADVLLRNDNNKRKPTAEIIRIVNQFLLDKMVKTTAESPNLRCYTSADTSGQNVHIFLMNKTQVPCDVVVTIKNSKRAAQLFRVLSFSGSSPHDRNPQYQLLPDLKGQNNRLKIQLQPLSLTVLKQKK